MLHALTISIVESAIALGLLAVIIRALRLSANGRFLMWATVLLVAFGGFGASLIASHRPPPATATSFHRIDVEIGAAARPKTVPAGQLTASLNAPGDVVELVAKNGESFWQWAELVWLAGTLIYMARIVVSLIEIIRMRRGAMAISSPAVESCASDLLSGSPKVRIVELGTIRSPLFLGFGPPMIALPEHLSNDLSRDDLRFIVAHELEHWRRRDDYIDFAAQLIVALLWPNPSVHLARGLMITERECACDHAASIILRSGVEAANSLWRSARICGQVRPTTTLAAVGPSSQLVTRIRRLISLPPLRERSGKILIVSAAPLVAMAIFFATIESPGTARADHAGAPRIRDLAGSEPPYGGTVMNDPQLAARRLESGETARREKRLHEARVDFAAAAGWYSAHGPIAMQIHALTRQAQIERDLRNYDAATDFQQRALQLQREIGPDGLPHVMRHLADILDDSGRYDEASRYYAEMESLYRGNSATPPLEMANAVRSLAVHAEHRGDKERAHQLWTEARDRYSKLDQLFLKLTGERRNPGVEEAERRLASL